MSIENFLQWWLILNEPEERKIIEVKSNLIRPKTFNEYVGQERAKKILIKYIEGSKERESIFPHTLIYGSAGMGKTTLANIIANELNVDFKSIISSSVKDISIEKRRIVTTKVYPSDGGILFLDEIHAISRDMAEKFYPIMEDFRYNNIDIEKFTLIGATTELGEIIKNRKPFYDRFKIILELEEYAIKDLIMIAKKYKERIFPLDKLEDAIYEKIAINCRGTPRQLIRLLNDTIYFKGNIDEVLLIHGIIKNGITEKDIKLLKYLTINNVMGLNGIVNYLDTSTENYLYEIEPFLLKNNLIIRTPRGRKISDKAIELLKELK